MLEQQRHHMLLDILAERQFASVPELVAQLASSPSTIRRDITDLAKLKKLKKIRGGAQAVNGSHLNDHPPQLPISTFLNKGDQNTDARRRIAEKAVELCADGESIIINGGSSTHMMREFLTTRHLNILTNSLYLAYELTNNSENQITLPGGEIYPRQGIILSAFESDTIQHYCGSKMFMGAPGVSEFGVMESDPLLIRSAQKLLKQADKLIILADSSTLGKRSNFIFEALDAVDMLITDSNADEMHINFLLKAGVEVIQV